MAAARKLPLPQTIRDAPELLHGLELYWHAWFDLNSGRDGARPIPWRDVQHLCDVYGLRDEYADAMHAAIKSMDGFYLAHIQKGKP